MFSTWVMRGLGGLLLLAAGLKMYGLAVEPIGRAGFFSQPWVQTGLVEWEIFLGLWLIWGQYRAGVWLVATATFLVFACFNFWQGWIGQGSCGCFGRIHINPWATFGMDVTVLGFLAAASRREVSTQSVALLPNAVRAVSLGAGGVIAALSVFAAIGTVAFGSPAAALAYLRGERLSLEPALLDVGEGNFGERKQLVIHVRNWTEKPVRILGGTSDCSCVVTRDLPLSVEPGGMRPLAVTLTMNGTPGQFTRLVRVYIEDEGFRVVSFRITGRVEIPEASTSLP